MVEYFYQLSIAPASGEFSLSTLLESGAYARRPLVDRLGALKMDVRILYGDRDWMLLKGGGECLRDVKVCVLQGAGHHLYFDNVDAFMRQVEDACDSCIPESPAVAPSP